MMRAKLIAVALLILATGFILGDAMSERANAQVYACPPGYYFDPVYGCMPLNYFYGPPYYVYPDFGFTFFYGGRYYRGGGFRPGIAPRGGGGRGGRR